jgi:alkylation response protein AidB-like acyl-CoA dehydrogenase
MACGSEEQKRRYLPKILSGEEVWCQGFSEPGAGSDLASLRTRAELDGDEWVVNGQKVWSTMAHLADWCELLVRTEPDAPKHRGISCLLIDMRTPGIEVRPLRQITGRSDFNEVFFTDVRVPRGRMLGERGQGWGVAMATLASERAAVLSSHVWMRRRVADLAELIAQRGLADDAAVRQKLGALAVDAEILGLLSMWSATQPSAGFEGPMAKLLWSEAMQRLYETAIEVLGPDGAIEGPWLESLLDSRSYTIAAGTSEIMRNVLAERALGMPREPR